MARSNKKNNSGKINPVQSVIDNLLLSIDDSYQTKNNLTEKHSYFKSITNDELSLTKGVANNSIVDFARAMTSDIKKENVDKLNGSNDSADIAKLIAANTATIYQLSSDQYKNKFIEDQDLRFISKFIPSVAQAVKIVITHVTSSDDLSGSFSRNLDFGTALTEEQEETIKEAIENYENENGIPKKLKKCFKNTAVVGRHYAIAIGYTKLFNNYHSLLEERKKKPGIATESALYENVGETFSTNLEFTTDEYTDIFSEVGLKKDPLAHTTPVKLGTVTNDTTPLNMDSLKKYLPTIECIEGSSIPFTIINEIPALEAATEGSKKTSKNSNVNFAADASYDINAKKAYNVEGTYIKFVHARNMLPIKMVDNIIGYLYVVASSNPLNKTNFAASSVSSLNKENVLDKISNMLANKIANNFSEKFVAGNIEFKKLIADCIMANGVINTQYKIQFLPVEDVVPFHIDEDEDGNGTSILSNSLFPGKLLANYMIKKNLNYINKSGDKTIAHIRGGNADVSKSNQSMRVIRDLQEQNITAMDLLSSNSTCFQKFAYDNTMVMPQSRAGNRLVEFEKMDGQSIDMGSEYEKFLENLTILGTPVPPLMIEQANNADFSKAFTTAHIGLAGNIKDIQEDLEGDSTNGTTALYLKIIENLPIDSTIKQLVKSSFKFKLPRPKALSAINNNEAIQNATSLAEAYCTLRFKEDDDPNVVRKTKLAIVKEMTPFIHWDVIDDIADDVILRETTPKDEVKDSRPSSSSSSSDGGYEEGDDSDDSDF